MRIVRVVTSGGQLVMPSYSEYFKDRARKLAEFRARLEAMSKDNPEECWEMHFHLERVKESLGISTWRALEAYIGKIPLCVRKPPEE